MAVFLVIVLEQKLMHMVIDEEVKSFIRRSNIKMWSFFTKQEPLSLFLELKDKCLPVRLLPWLLWNSSPGKISNRCPFRQIDAPPPPKKQNWIIHLSFLSVFMLVYSTGYVQSKQLVRICFSSLLCICVPYQRLQSDSGGQCIKWVQVSYACMIAHYPDCKKKKKRTHHALQSRLFQINTMNYW